MEHHLLPSHRIVSGSEPDCLMKSLQAGTYIYTPGLIMAPGSGVSQARVCFAPLLEQAVTPGQRDANHSDKGPPQA